MPVTREGCAELCDIKPDVRGVVEAKRMPSDGEMRAEQRPQGGQNIPQILARLGIRHLSPKETRQFIAQMGTPGRREVKKQRQRFLACKLAEQRPIKANFGWAQESELEHRF